MTLAAMAGVLSGYRPKHFWPPDYDLLTWIRLGRSGGVNSYTYESGTEADIKRIQSVTDPGSAGGAYSQGNAANRPVAVRYTHGLAAYFDGTDYLQSNAPLNTLAPLCDETGTALAGGVFLVTDLSTTRTPWACRAAAGGAPGMGLEILSNGTIRIAHNNGGSTQFIASSTGTVVVGTVYYWTIEKSGTSIALRLNGSQVASDTIADPLTQNHGAITFGAASNGAGDFLGFQWGFLVFSGANMPTTADLETYLSQFTLADEPNDLIAMYAADGSIAHACVPESIQRPLLTSEHVSDPPNLTYSGVIGGDELVVRYNAVLGAGALWVEVDEVEVYSDSGPQLVGFTGPIEIDNFVLHIPEGAFPADTSSPVEWIATNPDNVTAWNDTVGEAHLVPTGGAPTTSTLDGLAAVEVPVGVLFEASIPVTVAEGSNAFGVMVYGMAPANPRFWVFSGGSAEHRRFTQLGGNHNVARGAETSGSVSRTDAQRFFADSFKGAGSADNLKIIDGAVSSPALNVADIGEATALAMFRPFASATTWATALLWSRAFNVGEAEQMRWAILALTS